MQGMAATQPAQCMGFLDAAGGQWAGRAAAGLEDAMNGMSSSGLRPRQ